MSKKKTNTADQKLLGEDIEKIIAEASAKDDYDDEEDDNEKVLFSGEEDDEVDVDTGEQDDITVYGADDDVDLDDDDDSVGDLDDLDGEDFSDDDESVMGLDIEDDDMDGEEEDTSSIILQLKDLIDKLVDDHGEGEDFDLGGDDDDLGGLDLDAEGDEDYDMDMDAGDGDMDMDYDAAEAGEEDEEDEDEDEDEDKMLRKEEADASSWKGTMQKLKDPNASHANKAAPSGKAADRKTSKGKQDAGVFTPDEVYTQNTKGNSATKKAPDRKTNAINQIVNQLQKSNFETIKKLYSASEMIAQGGKLNRENFEFDFTRDINKLAMLDKSLDEGFKVGAAKLFEAVLKNKVNEIADKLEVQYAIEFSESLERERLDLVEKIDEYLDYVSNTYVEENKIAIDEGLRSDLLESFLTGMRNLFNEHYVDVPEAKVDLIQDLSDRLDEANARIGAATKAAIKERRRAVSLERDIIVREASDDLSLRQSERLSEQAKRLDFENSKSFRAAVNKLKTEIFGRATALPESHDFEASAPEVESGSTMDNYLAAIRRTAKPK